MCWRLYYGKNKKKSSKLNEVRKSYLLAAISDVSGNIQLMDTKVSIIMAAQGVIIAGLLSIYDNLAKVAKYYDSVLEKSVCVITVLGFFIFMTLVYVFGLRTIEARSTKLNKATSWFVTSDRLQKGFDDYLLDFKSKSDDNLLDEIASELFKLNDINSRKMEEANWTVKMFKLSPLSRTF